MRVLMVLDADPEALASETLASEATAQTLSDEDSRLARTLVFGVLRRALTLDHLYGRFLTRRLAATDPGLRLLLRLGAFQHYYLSRIPDYAIVNETIELGRQILKLPAKDTGFLNAILRKIVSDNAEVEPALPPGNRVSALSVRYSVPSELTAILVEKYGTLKAAEIMHACNEDPPMTIRTNRLRTTREALRDLLLSHGFSVEYGLLAPDALIVASSPGTPTPSLFDTEAFHGGLFYAQDEGSQMVSHLAHPLIRGRLLDLCSAPGGKTTHLAELTGGGVDITATDSSVRRLEMVRENIARLGTPGVKVVPMDLASADKPYDTILVDAPCSGLGTIRRNPEVRYRITPQTLARHRERQVNVLETAASLASDNGVVVYSTCSISPQENQGAVADFLKNNPAWKIALPGPGDSAELASPKRSGFFETWPRFPQLDGFEAVVLIKEN